MSLYRDAVADPYQRLCVLKVLERIAKQVLHDEDELPAWADALEDMLQLLHNDDFFGTEGQSDPRGDFRNGAWSMSLVEGVDK